MQFKVKTSKYLLQMFRRLYLRSLRSIEEQFKLAANLKWLLTFSRK